MESDPLIVQIVAGSEMVVLVGYEIHIGETVGTINFCIPLMVLNPILDQISQQAHYARRVTGALADRTRLCIAQALCKSQAPIDAILGRAEITLHDVARLQVGDIITLDRSTRDPVEVQVGGVPKFLAKRGRLREQSAVQLLDFIEE